jgi:hypothetical protein
MDSTPVAKEVHGEIPSIAFLAVWFPRLSGDERIGRARRQVRVWNAANTVGEPKPVFRSVIDERTGDRRSKDTFRGRVGD